MSFLVPTAWEEELLSPELPYNISVPWRSSSFLQAVQKLGGGVSSKVAASMAYGSPEEKLNLSAAVFGHSLLSLRI